MNSDAFAARLESAVLDGWFGDPPPFLRAMAVAPTMAIASAFVLEWTKFSRWFPRWVGAVMSNCDEFDVLAFEVENLMSEVVRDPAAGTNHYELLIRLGEGAGLQRGAIESHLPRPQSVDAFAHWDRMARQPDWLLGFAAINGLEILGDRNLAARQPGRQGTGLDPGPWATTGIASEALEFFRVSDATDATHGNETVQLLARHTPEGRQDEVVSVLRESMDQLRQMMTGLSELAEQIGKEVER